MEAVTLSDVPNPEDEGLAWLALVNGLQSGYSTTTHEPWVFVVKTPQGEPDCFAAKIDGGYRRGALEAVRCLLKAYGLAISADESVCIFWDLLRFLDLDARASAAPENFVVVVVSLSEDRVFVASYGFNREKTLAKLAGKVQP